MQEPPIVVCYFLEFLLYLGNGHSHGNETFEDVNGVADIVSAESGANDRRLFLRIWYFIQAPNVILQENSFSLRVSILPLRFIKLNLEISFK